MPFIDRTNRLSICLVGGLTLLVSLALLRAPASAQEATAQVVIEEILVTAQRRTERLQDVPMTVNVVSATDLEKSGVARTADALSLVPGLTFETFGTTNQSNIFLRGVGTSLTDGGVETSVAMYVDDVYIGAQQAFNVALFDAERVEVLRGPQGTLYGKNALGGALKFYSVPPQADLSGKLEAAFGNYDYRQLRGTLNVPLADGRIRTRLTGTWEERDGVVENRWPGGPDQATTDSLGLRGQAAFDASDALTVTLSADWGRDKPTIQVGDPDTILRDRFVMEPNVPVEDRDVAGGSVNAVYTAGNYSLTSISAYRTMTIDTVPTGDLANTAFTTEQDIDFDQISQELRLSSADDRRMQWTVGAFYYQDESTYDVPFNLLGLAGVFGYPEGYEERSRATLDSETVALLGDVTVALYDRWHVSVGARFSHERRSLSYAHNSTVSDPDFQEFIDGLFGPDSGLTPDLFRFAPLQDRAERISDDDVSPRLVLSYQPLPGLHFYSSVAKGYKSGSFNTLFVAGDSQFAFAPEEAWSYELGMKSAWFDDRLGFDLAAYHTDWKDQQVRSFVPAGPAFQLLITNAASSTSQGIDLTLSAAATQDLRLGLSYSYIDATFESFTTSPAGDLTGNRLPFVPRHSAVATVDFSHAIGANLLLDLHADFSYRTDAYADDVNDPLFELESRGVANASAGIGSGNWEVRLWGRNLFDEKYSTSGSQGILGPRITIGEPRTYGLRLIASFGN